MKGLFEVEDAHTLEFLINVALRLLIFGKISSKFKNKNTKKNDFIEGEFEDIEDDNER